MVLHRPVESLFVLSHGSPLGSNHPARDIVSVQEVFNIEVRRPNQPRSKSCQERFLGSFPVALKSSFLTQITAQNPVSSGEGCIPVAQER